MIKILCICGYGNVRSVAMAQFIKELNGKYRPLKDEEIEYEAIAIGKKVTSTETMNMLKEWADKIIDVTKYLPEDIWHNPRHKEIMEAVKKTWEYYTEEHP